MNNLLHPLSKEPYFINQIYFSPSQDTLLYLYNRGEVVKLTSPYSLEEIFLDNCCSYQELVEDARVDEYCYESDYPPVVVCKRKRDYVVIDGNHRANALLSRGVTTVHAKVYDLRRLKREVERFF